MDETRFIEASEALMNAVEDAVEAAGIDVEGTRAGNVLTLEADNGEQVVINRHTPTGQMWLASRRGGLHFEFHDGGWTDTRSGKTFWTALEEALGQVCGSPVHIRRP